MHRSTIVLWTVALAFSAAAATAQPSLVPQDEGQVGTPPVFVTNAFGAGFLPLDGDGTTWLVSQRTVVPPSTNSNVSFLTDTVHDEGNPITLPLPPGLDREFDEGGPDSDSGRRKGGRSIPFSPEGPITGYLAFSRHQRGTAPDTIQVTVDTFDQAGVPLATFVSAEVPIFPSFTAFLESDVTVDPLGRATVVYSSFTQAGGAQVMMQQVDAVTGAAIGGPLSLGLGFDPEIEALDPMGDRLLVVAIGPTGVEGRVVDTAAPVIDQNRGVSVGAPFTANTTSVLAIERPTVAADPDTGAFTIAWDAIADNPGDPVNVRARRYDASGNPIGNDFVPHEVLAGAQAQAAMEYGPNGELGLVFVGDDGVGQLDTFVRAFLPNGDPIGMEQRAHAGIAGRQDLPSVRFLPAPDAQGRPQLAVLWRDVGAADGSNPNGSGMGYRCFSIDGLPGGPIGFTDGFESGDTSAWSATVP